MIRPCRVILVAIALLALTLACSGEQTEVDTATVDHLAEAYATVGIDRAAPPRLFVGQDLYEYINGGAELYHLYGFQEVATADYKKGATEMVVDLYRFDSPLNAFGLYSMLRPDEADLTRLGVEGFLAPSKIEFVKGDLLVRVIGYDDSDETGLALINLADEINKQLPGATKLPTAFESFPSAEVVDGSAKYFTEAYLGQSFLTSVYCRDYQMDSSVVTLFLCQADGGAKLLEWSHRAEEAGKLVDAPADLTFDDGKAIGINDSYYGQIVAGIKGGQMVGMVGFSVEHQAFLDDWLDAIQ
ncbi:MAG: hypothetical protein OEV49_09520 [candidate division Zixibacteria bacterium]|nr:hypothetical protein [candidate division Zixibacteria bacterium]MDH3937381.1 hypothetical protein [candidate division Zixibacteria bacterium]MDH4033247.1 hypothetical protein [candidate division Zixibacteria bacterium]